MAHWRDGGIGTMPGSDDRPIEEWTLLEKLAELASAPLGGPMPKSMGNPTVNNWATPLKQIAQGAFDEIQRLRGGEIAPGCSINAEKTVLTLYGMRYALGLFELMAALKVDACFRVISREGDTLTVLPIEDPRWPPPVEIDNGGAA